MWPRPFSTGHWTVHFLPKQTSWIRSKFSAGGIGGHHDSGGHPGSDVGSGAHLGVEIGGARAADSGRGSLRGLYCPDPEPYQKAVIPVWCNIRTQTSNLPDPP